MQPIEQLITAASAEFAGISDAAQLEQAKARYLGYRIKEIPVKHYPRTAGRSSIRPTHIPYTLWELAKMWVNIYIRKRI